MPAPLNDNIADADEVTDLVGSLVITTLDATVETDEAALVTLGAGRSVWAAWTCPASGAADEVIFTCATHVLAAFTGTVIADLVLLEEAAGSVAFVPTIGERYLIRVDAVPITGVDAGTLSWSAGEPEPDPDEAEQGVLVADETEEDVPDDDPIIDADLSSIGVLRRYSETYPSPTRDPDSGRPVDWAPSSVVDEEWGRVSIAVGGVAVTTVRGVKSQLTSLVLQEPFGEGPAQLVVRGATLWDKGQAGFEWLAEEKNVDISRVDADGVYVRTIWSGIVLTVQPAGRGGGWVLQLEGAFAGPAGMFPHRPKLTEAERDWGSSLVFAIRRASGGHARRRPVTEVSFGITTRDRGSRSETLLEYVSRGLSLSQTNDGDQWTFTRQLDGSGHPIRRKYYFRLKDRETEHLTVRAGQRGIDVSGLRRDLSDVARVIFGEGVNSNGGRWRNTKLPNVGKETIPPFNGPLAYGDTGVDVLIWQREVVSDGHRTGNLDVLGSGSFLELEEDVAREIQRNAGLPVTGIVDEDTWDATWSNGNSTLNLGGARFDPIAADPRVVGWLYSSNGSVLAPSGTRDRSVLAIGRFVSYGSDVTKAQGTRSARAELARAADAGWRGTIVIDGVDPPEMSRLDILEGMNIRVLDFDDEPLLHIAGVRWSQSGPSWSVSLDVDEHARDLLTLAQLKARDREAKQDPARQAIAQLRRSTQVRDTPSMWDAEGGFGVLPSRNAAAGWNVYTIAAGKYGSLSRVRIVAEPETRLCLALFGASPTRSWLRANVPNPFADVDGSHYGPWDKPALQDGLHDRLFIEAFGAFEQRGGYSPGFETDPSTGDATGHPVTGVLDVESSTDYALLSEPRIYVAVYVEAATSVSGQLYLLPNE